MLIIETMSKELVNVFPDDGKMLRFSDRPEHLYSEIICSVDKASMVEEVEHE